MQTKQEVEEPEVVKVIGNEVFFYGDISQESILEFIEKFKKLEISLLKSAADMIGFEPMIKVHIMSDGGDLFAGVAAMNVLEKSRVKVVTVADGACCSAATFVLLGGSERRMGPNAHLLIHQLSTSEFWGKFEDLKDEMRSCTKLMQAVKLIYMKKTSIPEKKFKKLMKRDIYLSASKCLKYKIVHVLD